MLPRLGSKDISTKGHDPELLLHILSLQSWKGYIANTHIRMHKCLGKNTADNPLTTRKTRFEDVSHTCPPPTLQGSVVIPEQLKARNFVNVCALQAPLNGVQAAMVVGHPVLEQLKAWAFCWLCSVLHKLL